MNLDEHQLGIPSNCDNCQSVEIRLTENKIVYEVNKGAWPYCYYCDNCGAMVACHPNTNKPMGLMAVGSIRRKRGKLHELFDPIWKYGYLSRTDAYEWLAKQLDIHGVCHIGMLNKEQLVKAISMMTAHNKNGYAQFVRRKNKNKAKEYARIKREDSRIARRKYGD